MVNNLYVFDIVFGLFKGIIARFDILVKIY